MHVQAQEAASADKANEQSPLGAFVTHELMAGGFLRQLLQPFLEDVTLGQPVPRNRQLHSEASSLKAYVQETFGWNFGMQELRRQAAASAHDPRLLSDDDEADDEAPVVVDLEEPYAL